uniref:Uncharacterized protein n=1 Tax=Hyaloperonospora arabidopsidis (strain Emoy2) TaxID=559515 RepID=M4B212_HYAAE
MKSTAPSIIQQVWCCLCDRIAQSNSGASCVRIDPGTSVMLSTSLPESQYWTSRSNILAICLRSVHSWAQVGKRSSPLFDWIRSTSTALASTVVVRKRWYKETLFEQFIRQAGEVASLHDNVLMKSSCQTIARASKQASSTAARLNEFDHTPFAHKKKTPTASTSTRVRVPSTISNSVLESYIRIWCLSDVNQQASELVRRKEIQTCPATK